MENIRFTNSKDIQIQGLLDRFLNSQTAVKNIMPEDHLDADMLTAFTEGNLNERETIPVVNHLIDCSFCRHVTTELVRLDLDFSGETTTVAAIENQPSKISEVLGNLLSRIFGTNDGAVFAHQEEETETEETKDLEAENK